MPWKSTKIKGYIKSTSNKEKIATNFATWICANKNVYFKIKFCLLPEINTKYI
jgi:hypothetical protein